MSLSREFPPLDAHAHVAPDVTSTQIATLGGALVLAMTRDLDEAAFASRRRDPSLCWGIGTHPGVPAALDRYDAAEFRALVEKTPLVGEVGLDRRGPKSAQTTVFASVLKECAGRAVLLSIHSTGMTGPVIEMLGDQPHAGAILHWFNGDQRQIETAAQLGAYFSVNAAMSPDVVRLMPPERLLPETDFPSSRRTTRARIPGDVDALESAVSAWTGQSTQAIRARWYQNLARLAAVAGVTARLPLGFLSAVDPA
jgi:TatD DNase family protein